MLDPTQGRGGYCLHICTFAQAAGRFALLHLSLWPSDQLINQWLPIHHRNNMPHLLISHHRADGERNDFAMQRFGQRQL